VPEQGLVELAVGVLLAQGSVNGENPYRTPAVAERQVVARDAVPLHQGHGTLVKALHDRTLREQLAKALALEDVAEPIVRVAGHPAIALDHVAPRVDGDDVVGAVVGPDAGCASGSRAWIGIFATLVGSCDRLITTLTHHFAESNV
jgi:hypothetical protein